MMVVSGIIVGGLLLLVIFSLLTMARKGEEAADLEYRQFLQKTGQSTF